MVPSGPVRIVDLILRRNITYYRAMSLKAHRVFRNMEGKTIEIHVLRTHCTRENFGSKATYTWYGRTVEHHSKPNTTTTITSTNKTDTTTITINTASNSTTTVYMWDLDYGVLAQPLRDPSIITMWLGSLCPLGLLKGEACMWVQTKSKLTIVVHTLWYYSASIALSQW
jgi:hypothetical protein